MKPIIIIGAGRSGTNILRDVLTSFEGVVTWPCDEINYIWRHGNRSYATDQFSGEMASDRISSFIRNEFEKLAQRAGGSMVVEKTCANTLRVPFLHKVFPEAKFINLVRDGRDVAFSASERWKAPLDFGYLAQKARYVPKSDLFYYASRYFLNHLHRLTSGKKRVATWGPRFEGMQEVFSTRPIEVACAIQWRICVESAHGALEAIPSGQVHSLTYESLTANPKDEILRLLRFVGVDAGPEIDSKVSSISSRSVGRWKKLGSEPLRQELEQEIGETLDRFGYDT